MWCSGSYPWTFSPAQLNNSWSGHLFGGYLIPRSRLGQVSLYQHQQNSFSYKLMIKSVSQSGSVSVGRTAPAGWMQSNVNKCDDKWLRPSHSAAPTGRLGFSGLMWCDAIVTIYKPRWETWHWIWGREGGRVTHNDDNDVFSHQEVAPGQGLNICQNNPRCLDRLGAPPLLTFSYQDWHPLIFTGFY